MTTLVTTNERKELFSKKLDGSMSYKTFRALIDDLLQEGKTTGPNQSESYINYARLNQVRMQRLEKTVKIGEKLSEILKNISTPQTWLVLAEGWCGDVAQNLPVIKKMAALSDNINLRIILRDDNLDIMNLYKTSGGIAIPKLVAIQDDSLDELFTWGPRPEPAQKMVMKNKQTQARTYSELSEEVQKWYSKDKTGTIQKEFVVLLS